MSVADGVDQRRHASGSSGRRAMISSDCTIGTPDFIIVAIWRLKIAISRGGDALAGAAEQRLAASA